MENTDALTITPPEYSRLTGLTLGYVYARLWSGRIPGAQKIDGQWHIPRAAVMAYLDWRHSQLTH